MKFCQRCYDKMVKDFAKKANYDPKCKLLTKTMVFPCQVPLYEPDPSSGEQMVRIWNCKDERFVVYSLKAYNDMKARGEI